jgi:Domain of Unknown Function (DUF1206)
MIMLVQTAAAEVRSMQQRTYEWLARLGYAAHGCVYVIMGGLAVLAAFGTGGQTTGAKGALLTLLSQPFGFALLGLVAFGLLCFSSWRLAQSILDADRLGTEGKSVMRRIGYGVSAIVHASLAFFAVSVVFGLKAASRSDEQSARDWTAYLLAAPFGRWLIGAVGLIIVAAGIGIAVKGLTASFEKDLAMQGEARRWIVPLGRLGFMARGLIFGIVGVFLIFAAVDADPGEARGLGGAMRVLQAQPFGRVLFAITALGLFAFGIFQLVVAYYRRIDPSKVERVFHRRRAT